MHTALAGRHTRAQSKKGFDVFIFNSAPPENASMRLIIHCAAPFTTFRPAAVCQRGAAAIIIIIVIIIMRSLPCLLAR